jgi:hypothetical protein
MPFGVSLYIFTHPFCFYIYMKTKRKKPKSKRKKHSLKTTDLFKGGMPIIRPLPSTILAQFPISDDNISNFTRNVMSPRDCVISALQLMGFINNQMSNLLRITCAGKTGFQQEEIELIFTLLTGFAFHFQSVNKGQEFLSYITKHLRIGHVVFAGILDHVFLLWRRNNGSIWYIDPSVSTVCNIMDPACNKWFNTANIFFLLHHSENKLAPDQLRQIGFIV